MNIITELIPARFDAFRKILFAVDKEFSMKMVRIIASKLVHEIERNRVFLVSYLGEFIGGSCSFSMCIDMSLTVLQELVGNEPVEVVANGNEIFFDNRRYLARLLRAPCQPISIPPIRCISSSGKSYLIDELPKLRRRQGKRPVELQINGSEILTCRLPTGAMLRLAAQRSPKEVSKCQPTHVSRYFCRIPGYEAYLRLLKTPDAEWLVTTTILGEGMSVVLFERLNRIRPPYAQESLGNAIHTRGDVTAAGFAT